MEYYGSPCDDMDRFQKEKLQQLEEQDRITWKLADQIQSFNKYQLVNLAWFIRTVIANEESNGDYCAELERAIGNLRHSFKGELDGHYYQV